MKFKLPSHFRKLRNATAPGRAAPPSGRFGAWGLRRCAILAAFIAAASPAAAQEDESEILEPQALRLQVTDAYLGVLAIGQYNQSTISGQNGAATNENLFIGPDIGLDAFGSIYHPNFINFSVNGDISPGYNTQKSNQTGAASTGNSGFAVLGNYVANFNVLQEKPYRSTFYIDQSYSEQQNDFYNEIQESSLRYGANLGYQAGPVPFTINIWRQQLDTSGAVNENSSQEETGLLFDASNKRASGGSSLNYSLTDYTLSNSGGQGNGSDQSASLSDAETFGGNRQFNLNSTASYSESNNGVGNVPGGSGGTSQYFNAAENFSIVHSPTLSSSYDVGCYYAKSDTPLGGVNSDGVNGDISLTHQLFESLTSSLTLDGFYDSSTDSFPSGNGGQPNSGTQSEQFNGALTETYTKRLGPSARFTITNSVVYEYTAQKDTGDTVVQPNESHTFSATTDSFSLNLPDVDQSSIIITNSQGALPAYQLGIDYTVFQNGSITMIRRTATSSIPLNSKVLVTYTAAASPSGHYETLNELLNFRIDLWNGVLGIYGRFSTLENYGAPSGNLPANSAQNIGANPLAGVANSTDYALGADTTWRWLHCGFEFEQYDSTFSSYDSVKLYQSATFRPDKASALSFSLGELLVHYVNDNTSEEDYSITTTYNRAVAQNLSLELEAGVEMRRGADADQTLAAVRSKLRYSIGETSVYIGYDFEYSLYLNSATFEEQFLYVSIRRNF